MAKFSSAQAAAFVEKIDLSGTPRALVPQDAEVDAGEVFDKAKTQAQLVGTGIFSFAQGVDAGVREAISDSALLAQLVANKAQSADKAPIDWFQSYAQVLQNVGWVLQDGGWTDYKTDGSALDVHKAILDVMTAALGPGAAALTIITSVVNALQSMTPDSPWLTLFERQKQSARIARFQIGLVGKDENDEVFVSLVACLVQADQDFTQVLFFKFKEATATFKSNSQKVSINRAALADLGPAIRTKVRAYQVDYLSSIKDL